MSPDAPSVVLASASKTRALLLQGAGIEFEAMPSAVDEQDLKRGLRAAGIDGAAMAERLAECKARSVAERALGRPVIGADQVLLIEDAVLDKPGDRAEAAAQLRVLRGRPHVLVSAVCVLREGRPAWRHNATASLRMRRFGDAFVEDYLDKIGAAALDGPGCYRVEGLGIQLFETIKGCHSTILGLPLLPLLAHLRASGVIAS